MLAEKTRPCLVSADHCLQGYGQLCHTPRVATHIAARYVISTCSSVLNPFISSVNEPETGVIIVKIHTGYYNNYNVMV